MDITYLGHSSFKVKGKTSSVVFDPFDSTSVGLPFSKTEADIVLISHMHDDHNASSSVQNVKKVFSSPGEYEVMDTSIIGLPSFHDDAKGEERGKNTIFIVEIDGIRIAHLGDLGHKLSDKQIETMGEINILMIPVGGHYTIGSDHALIVSQSIEPTIIIPMHYQVPGLKQEVFANLVGVEEFAKNVGVTAETLPKLTVSSDTLGEEQRLVILEKK